MTGESVGAADFLKQNGSLLRIRGCKMGTASRAETRQETTMSYESLSPEQQEKAKACRTADELSSLAAEEGFELSDEMLEGVAGGIDMPELPDERIDCHGFFIS
jgi:hypothetical protein